jgi:hypothetical protein
MQSRLLRTSLSSTSTSQGDLLIAPPSLKLGLAFLAPSILLSFISLYFFPILLFSVFLCKWRVVVGWGGKGVSCLFTNF